MSGGLSACRVGQNRGGTGEFVFGGTNLCDFADVLIGLHYALDPRNGKLSPDLHVAGRIGGWG